MPQGGAGILLLPCIFYEAWAKKYPEEPLVLQPPPGTVLTIIYSGEVPGFQTQKILPPMIQQLASMTAMSGRKPYLGDIKDYNQFIRKLNIAIKDALPPDNFAGFYWINCFLLFIAFLICCILVPSNPKALGGIIAMAVLFVGWGIIMPFILNQLYKYNLPSAISRILSEENRIASACGFQW